MFNSMVKFQNLPLSVCIKCLIVKKWFKNVIFNNLNESVLVLIFKKQYR